MSVHFKYNNISNLFTVTASSSLTGFPVSNVITKDLNRVWRATKASDVYITFSGSTSRSMSAFFLYNTNLSVAPGASEYVQVQISNTGFSSYFSYNLNRRNIVLYKYIDGTVTTETRTILFYIFETPVSYKQFRIRLSEATSHPYSYYQVGEVFCFGSEFDMSIGGYEKGFQFGSRVDESSVKNQYGNVFPISRYKRNEGTFNFLCSNSELQTIENICFYPHSVFFPTGLGVDISNPNDFYLGGLNLSSVAENKVVFGGSYFDKSIQIKFEEVI